MLSYPLTRWSVSSNSNLSVPLYFGPDKKCLPAWAEFFIGLGEAFFTDLFSNRIPIIVLTVPTRAYAGVLIAAGYQRASFILRPTPSIAEHLKTLQTHKKDTTISYRLKETIQFGFLQEVSSEIVRFTLGEAQGNATTIPSERSLAVRIFNNGEAVRLPKTRIVRKGSSFVRAILQSEDASDFEICVDKELVLAGAKDIIQEELCLELLVEGDGFYKGRLKDILLMEGEIEKGVTARTRLSNDATPKGGVRLIDGFRYIHDANPSECSGILLILDKTEPGYEFGLSKAKEWYSRRASNDEISGTMTFLKNVEIPRGIQLTAFFWNRPIDEAAY